MIPAEPPPSRRSRRAAGSASASGLGRTRALLRGAGIARARLAGRAHRRHQRQGQHPGDGRVDAGRRRHRVGQTPKPHLVSYRERIVVDGSPIARGGLRGAGSRGPRRPPSRVARRHGPPTEFEALTCAALLWFAQGGCRLPASSRWAWAAASMPPTRGTAAWRRSPTWRSTTWSTWATRHGHRPREGGHHQARRPRRDGRRRCRAAGRPTARRPDAARRSRVAPPLAVLAWTALGMRVVHPGLGELRLGLLGRHQAANAAVALGVIEALREAGIADVERWRASGRVLPPTRWPGRLETR